MNFGVNYLGHFLLTELLMPLLIAAKDDILYDGPRHFKPKIINVSCSNYGKYKLDIDNMLSTSADTDVDPW